MIEIGSDAEVPSDLSAQTRLQKTGSLIGLASFVLLCNFLPTISIVAILAGVGEPAESRAKFLASIAMVGIVGMVGSVISGLFYCSLRDDFTLRTWSRFEFCCALISTLVALAAVHLELETAAFLGSFLLAGIAIAASSIITKIASSQRRARPRP